MFGRTFNQARPRADPPPSSQGSDGARQAGLSPGAKAWEPSAVTRLITRVDSVDSVDSAKIALSTQPTQSTLEALSGAG